MRFAPRLLSCANVVKRSVWNSSKVLPKFSWMLTLRFKHSTFNCGFANRQQERLLRSRLCQSFWLFNPLPQRPLFHFVTWKPSLQHHEITLKPTVEQSNCVCMGPMENVQPKILPDTKCCRKTKQYSKVKLQKLILSVGKRSSKRMFPKRGTKIYCRIPNSRTNPFDLMTRETPKRKILLNESYPNLRLLAYW